MPRRPAENKAAQAIPPARLHWVILGGIAAVGLALRWLRWTADELRPDEAFLGYVSGLPLADILPLAWGENTPPMAHFLTAISERLFGPGEAALRLPFLLGGSLLAPAAYLSGRSLFGERAGIFAGLIIALSPIHCSYSQIARAYALLPLFALASMAALHFLLARKRRADIPIHAAATAAAIYCHQWGLFLIPCAYLVQLMTRDPGGFRKLLISHGILAGLCLPLLPAFRPNPEQVDIVKSFYVPVWHDTPPALAIPKSLEGLWAGGQYSRHTTMKIHRAGQAVRGDPRESLLPRLIAGTPPEVWRVLCWITLLGLLALGLVPYRDDSFSPRGGFEIRCLLGVHLAVPLVLGWIVSLVITPIYLVGRHDVMVLPFLALIAGAGLAKLRWRMGTAIFGVYGLLAATTLIPFYLMTFAEGNRDRARLLVQEMKEGDVVIYTGYTQNPIEYYMRPHPLPEGTLTFPSGMAAHRTGIPLRKLSEEPGWIWKDVGTVMKRLGEIRSRGGSVYVVESAGPWTEVLDPLLQGQLQGPEVSTLGRSGITRYRPGKQ